METLEEYIRNCSLDEMAGVILTFVMNTRSQTFENVHNQLHMPMQFIEIPQLEKMSIIDMLMQPAENFIDNSGADKGAN